MTQEEEKKAMEKYLLEDEYRNMLNDKIQVKKDKYGYNENDIYIFPLWYYYENNNIKISLLKEAIEKKSFIKDLDGAINAERTFREKNNDIQKR